MAAPRARPGCVVTSRTRVAADPDVTRVAQSLEVRGSGSCSHHVISWWVEQREVDVALARARAAEVFPEQLAAPAVALPAERAEEHRRVAHRGLARTVARVLRQHREEVGDPAVAPHLEHAEVDLAVEGAADLVQAGLGAVVRPEPVRERAAREERDGSVAGVDGAPQCRAEAGGLVGSRR